MGKGQVPLAVFAVHPGHPCGPLVAWHSLTFPAGRSESYTETPEVRLAPAEREPLRDCPVSWPNRWPLHGITSIGDQSRDSSSEEHVLRNGVCPSKEGADVGESPYPPFSDSLHVSRKGSSPKQTCRCGK